MEGDRRTKEEVERKPMINVLRQISVPVAGEHDAAMILTRHTNTLRSRMSELDASEA